MATRVQVINALIKEHRLTIPLVCQLEVDQADSNRLRNLDARTDRRWRRDNDQEEQAFLLLAAIAVIRDFPAYELDHSHPKAKGGSNHISNIFPAPKALNRAKSDLEWTIFDCDYLINLDERIRNMFRIPDSFKEYLNVKDWLLTTYKS